jgi:hypothetical protein
MGTAIWGPQFWYIIHIVADSAPETLSEQEKNIYREFYESLIHVLPCPACSSHAKENLKKTPLVLDGRMSLLKWSVAFHNRVNEQLGKPVYSEEEGLREIQRWIQSSANGELIVKPPDTMEVILRSPILWTIIGILLGVLAVKLLQRK